MQCEVSSAKDSVKEGQERLKRARGDLGSAEERYHDVRAKVDNALESMVRKDGGGGGMSGDMQMPERWPRAEDGGYEEMKDEEPEHVTQVF